MKWPQEKLDALYELYSNGKSAIAIAQELNVTVPSVKSALYRRKNNKPIHVRSKYIRWDENLEQSILAMLENSSSLIEIAEKLGVTYSSLTSKMRRMDITFHKHNISNGHTPNELTELFVITNSQLRQALNNRALSSNVRGKQLFITDEALSTWLSNGAALIYRPRDLDGSYMKLWIEAYTNALRNVTVTDEIADVFGKSKMTITYYGKKRNFPMVSGFLRSFNIYNRHEVNQWAVNNNLPQLPETIREYYLGMIDCGEYKIYLQKKQDM